GLNHSTGRFRTEAGQSAHLLTAPQWMPQEFAPGNRSRPLGVEWADGAAHPHVHDALVRLLRPRQEAPRRQGASLRGDQPRRGPGVPQAAPRADGELDGAADPDRRAADRRLHRALAPRPDRRSRRAARCLRARGGPGACRCRREERLTAWAVRRAAAAGADLLDRRAAAEARLAFAPVDLELVLHRARRAVRGGVVADGGALPREPGLERPPDRAMEPPDLVVAELPSRPQRVDAGSPERLVGIDVPHAGERP